MSESEDVIDEFWRVVKKVRESSGPLDPINNPLHPLSNPLHPLKNPLHPLRNPLHPLNNPLCPDRGKAKLRELKKLIDEYLED